MILRRLAWASLLAIACLLFSAHYSRLAPCGAWTNSIFGEAAWSETDPGGFYFATAHELAWGEAPLFVGHPGATLLPLLRGVQSALYHTTSEGEVSFTRFTVQHLPEAFLASKLMMTALHLLSFAALYAVSKQLLRDDHAAAVATLGYASSLPVLYYLSRISVEPLMVLCFALGFWAIWRCEDRAVEGTARGALGYAGIAGVAAASGAVTKLAFLGPLPFFLALYLIVGRSRPFTSHSIDWPIRLRALAVFAAACVVTLTLYSQIIDWRAFAGTWETLAQTPSGRWSSFDFIPGLGAPRILLAAELGFVVCATAGWGLFVVRRPDQRGRALWLSAYGAYALALFTYRVALEGSFRPFHYAFIPLAVGAVFFGHFSVTIWRRFSSKWSWRSGVALALWLMILHGVGLAAVVDSRRHDAAEFARRQPFFSLISQVGPRDRLGVMRSPLSPMKFRMDLVGLHGFIFPTLFHPRRSVLREEIESIVIPILPSSVPTDAPRAFVPHFDAEVALLRAESRGS